MIDILHGCNISVFDHSVTGYETFRSLWEGTPVFHSGLPTFVVLSWDGAMNIPCIDVLYVVPVFFICQAFIPFLEPSISVCVVTSDHLPSFCSDGAQCSAS